MKKQEKIAIRSVELMQPIAALTDVLDYGIVQVFVCREGRALGNFEIENKRAQISASRLRQAIAQHLTLKVLDVEAKLGEDVLHSRALSILSRNLVCGEDEPVHPDPRIDISEPLQSLQGLQKGEMLDIPVLWKNKHLGHIVIEAHDHEVSVMRLRDAIVEAFGLQLLEPNRSASSGVAWSEAHIALMKRCSHSEKESEVSQEQLPIHVPVSIVVATRDRPEDLRTCLHGLVNQKSSRQIEIIVVDNNPASGVTPPVVAEFPEVRLIREYRKGLSYARNAGFVACTGDIAVATDDDVIFPPEWLERIVAPFARNDVMIVTGNVLPYELESRAQQFFELYGGLSRGYERFEVKTDWFESFRFRAVPTWELGATASAAFRTTIFSHPEIGLLYEALGVGMPAGCSEDTFLFYKVLKAGYTIVYEPAACVSHKHRNTMKALRKQLYNYSKGGVAYHLLTFLHDGDFRGLIRIFAELPLIHIWRLKEWLLRRTDYPPSLLLLEVVGNFVGPFALFRGWLRVKRQGKSATCVPGELPLADNTLPDQMSSASVQQETSCA